MTKPLQNVVISVTSDGIWSAQHVSSGKVLVGDSKVQVEALMRKELGLDEIGQVLEPPTHHLFSGLAEAIARFLEGPISDMLSLHSGYARLESFQDNTATIRLGGGCQGCPSSHMTLFNGVKTQLQSRFGEDVITDVNLPTSP